MDIRIGVSETPKEITVELSDKTDLKKLKKDIDSALSEENSLFWLTDIKGRQVGIPTNKIAYVDIGAAGSGNPVGFS
ncbi:MAG TPA: DUF3107 domain-containing protein [Acidimicrobiales bacterium]|nr:DUF3107 domain-containing protein [Acidimicrobiales bacterium]